MLPGNFASQLLLRNQAGPPFALWLFKGESLEAVQSSGWQARSALPGSQCPPQLRLTDGPLGASPAGGSLSWLLPCRFYQRLRSLFCLSPPPALVFWTPLFIKLILRYRQTHPISLSHKKKNKRWPKAAAGSVKQFSRSLASWSCIIHHGAGDSRGEIPRAGFFLCATVFIQI